MLRIGLTGGIGSGKSTVAQFFAARHVPVIDTDDISRELVVPGAPAFTEIASVFGADTLDSDGAIDRAKLRARVFANANERKRLEAILHPRIRAAVASRLDRLTAAYAIIAVPLLFETGFVDLVDRALVVDCSEALQIRRTVARSGLGEAQIRAIMATQATRAERLARAHDVIENNDDLSALERRVEELHQRYLTLGAG
jgi:dephospho-CoA kinase